MAGKTDSKTTFGLITGNRFIFSDHLVQEGRKTMLDVLKKAGYKVITLDEKTTTFGGTETLSDADQCAKLFDKNRDKIDGIIITLPNFGDEKGIANAIRRSGLNVPVLVHAYPDDVRQMKLNQRRDSFCGKMSVCNNLRQYDIPFTLTSLHTVDPTSEIFLDDLHRFAAACRVVRGLRNARFGAIGARTGPFNTVRYSEKLLEGAGITVETIDLSEMFGNAEKLSDSDADVKAFLDDMKQYVSQQGIPKQSLLKLAKFGVTTNRWIAENELNGTAIQCWTSIQEFFGITPCTVMSMMSESLMPSACEVDICGTIAMYILQQASESPSAIVDWNNNFADDPEKGVLFHCSNLPKSFFESIEMGKQDLVATVVDADKTYGTIQGRIAAGPFSYLRISTDDVGGTLCGYCGQGNFTDDELESFGGYGVIHVPDFQGLLQFICANGFEHHVSISRSSVADAIFEALDNYLGWDIYLHE